MLRVTLRCWNGLCAGSAITVCINVQWLNTLNTRLKLYVSEQPSEQLLFDLSCLLRAQIGLSKYITRVGCHLLLGKSAFAVPLRKHFVSNIAIAIPGSSLWLICIVSITFVSSAQGIQAGVR
jgi:hypothetical protein